MSRKFYTGAMAIVAGLFLCVGCVGAQAWDLKELKKLTEEQQKKNNLPGLGVAIVTSEGMKHLEVAGVRKKGSAEKVTKNDLWHLGSNGKAMTASMIARLVEAKKLKWDQTLGETFPELAKEMKPDFKSITLTQLLSHQSGLDANFTLANYVNQTDIPAARIKALKEAMAQQPKNPKGKFLYSNWGYTLAGAVAEQATQKSWETLMKEEVFEPLGLKSAGFGGIGTVGKIDQPWPHTSNGKAVSTNGPEMDNVPTMGPAGTIHMSLEDWGKFVTEHLKGRQGKSSYLTKETFEKLHTPIAGNYALGWIGVERPWGGKVLSHAGDNTMNHALVWAAPEKDFAALVVCNQSGVGGPCDTVAAGLLLGWVKNQSGSR